jgi:hypothetical protein
MLFKKIEKINFQIDSSKLKNFFNNVDKKFLERGCFFELTNLGLVIVTKDKQMNFAIGRLIEQPKVNIKFTLGISSESLKGLIRCLNTLSNADKVDFELYYKHSLIKEYRWVKVKKIILLARAERIEYRREKPFPKLLGDEEYLSFEINRKMLLEKINGLNLKKGENLVEMNLLSKNKKIVMKSIKSSQEIGGVNLKGDTAIYKINIEKFKYFINLFNDEEIKVFLHAIFFSIGEDCGLKFFTFITGRINNGIIYAIPSLVGGQAKFSFSKSVVYPEPTSF